MNSSKYKNRNSVWNQVIVDALFDAGLAEVVLCPGARNAMMSLTLNRKLGISCLTHIDERSGAFLALGRTMVNRQPSAICTTSGSAVANLVPALTEADSRKLPLVLITCDRPQRNPKIRVPQATKQREICSPLLHAQLDLPDSMEADLGWLRREIMNVVAESRFGPVQINVPQWGSYCSTEDEADWDGSPWKLEPIRSANLCPARLSLSKSTLAEVEHAAQIVNAGSGLKGVIVAGADMPLSVTNVETLITATGFPVLADICSGLRQSSLPGIITTCDAIAESQLAGLAEAELLIRLGDMPVSPMLQRILVQLSCPVLHISLHVKSPDFLSPDSFCLLTPTDEGIEFLSEKLSSGNDEWTARWGAAEFLASAHRLRLLNELPWGEVTAAGQICNARGFDFTHLANSLSVRHAGLVTGAHNCSMRVFSARGVNGTDGSLGTFLGELLSIRGRGLLLIGDQAMTHDLSALTNFAWLDVKGAICIMNNEGGGIFDMVACSKIDDYEKTMRNSPNVNFAAVAEAFGLAHRPCADTSSLTAALIEAATYDGMMVIEVIVPAGTAVRDMPQLIQGMNQMGF